MKTFYLFINKKYDDKNKTFVEIWFHLQNQHRLSTENNTIKITSCLMINLNFKTK